MSAVSAVTTAGAAAVMATTTAMMSAAAMRAHAAAERGGECAGVREGVRLALGFTTAAATPAVIHNAADTAVEISSIKTAVQHDLAAMTVALFGRRIRAEHQRCETSCDEKSAHG